MMPEKGISVIVPAFNEKHNIKQVCGGLVDVLSKCGREYEILVIDDGSNDGTGEAAGETGVKVVNHPYNKGYGASLKTGCRKASYPLLVFFDSDGQHNPEDIPRLLEKMDSGEYEMVVGSRGKNSPVKWTRAPGKKLLSVVANYLAGVKIPDLNSGLRAVRKEALMEFIHILPNEFSLTSTLTLALLKAGYNLAYIPITAGRRKGRSSNVRIIRDGIRTLLLITNIVVLFNPNKVFVPASIFMFLLGSLYALYTIITIFHIGSGALLLIITSLIIFFFGIIADQLSSMRREKR